METKLQDLPVSLSGLVILLGQKDYEVSVYSAGFDMQTGEEWIHFRFLKRKKRGRFTASSREQKGGNNLMIRDLFIGEDEYTDLEEFLNNL